MAISGTATANGSSTGHALQPKRGADTNGDYSFRVEGTLDGATVALQASADEGTTKTDVGTFTTLTAAGEKGQFLVTNDAAGTKKYYVTVSGVGGSTSITWFIFSPKGL